MPFPRFSSNGEGKDPTPDEKQTVEALNQRYHQLNELWERAEAKLRQISIPVDVCLCFKQTAEELPDSHPPEQILWLLGFVKCKGGWRICIAGVREGEVEGPPPWKPIGECPLEVRLEAVSHLRELRTKVIEAAKDCLSKLDKGIQGLGDTLSSW